jgi:hypothetical protein
MASVGSRHDEIGKKNACKMKTVLLVNCIDSHFVELSRVARVLNESRKYKPVIWFTMPYPACQRDMEMCRKEGWEFVLSFVASAAEHVPTSSFLKTIIKLLPRKLTFPLFFIYGLYKYPKTIKIQVKETIHFVNKYDPSLLIMCEENVGYFTHISIRICHTRNIPTVIVPYTISNASEAAEFHYYSIEHRLTGNIINQLVAERYPHWVYEHRGRKLLRLPAAMIIALERSGYSHAFPWKLNSEPTAFIAVENEHMLEYYRNENLPEDRLILTGALYDDVLAESVKRSKEVRRNLIAEVGLQDGLPILLCALPPSQFPRDCEFSDYETLISFWMQTLAQVKGWNVVVRPHPRLTEGEIDHLREFGVKISSWDTASLVPLCDLYVASVSATIRWAIACGKPVVNYDVYQMKYTDYKDTRGVLTVFSKNEFKDTINRLTNDHVYYDDISAIQSHEMSKWGCLDGKSSERLLQLFDEVISRKIRRIEK